MVKQVDNTHVVFGDLVPLRELCLPLLSLATAMRPTRGALGPLPPRVGPSEGFQLLYVMSNWVDLFVFNLQ